MTNMWCLLNKVVLGLILLSALVVATLPECNKVSCSRYEKKIWTDWSVFGKCSRPCGGAYMVRTRKCIAPGFCGASNQQSDQRPCNQVPCYRRCPVKKVVLCDLWTTCTRVVYEYCHPYCYKGFMLHGAQCVPG